MSSIDEIVREIEAVLVECCRHKKTMTYGDVAASVNSVRLNPRHPWLHEFLDDISREEDGQGRGMLSAVVVRKDTGFPGEGFYRLARKLGRDVSDKTRFWRQEFDRVTANWEGGRQSTG